MEDHTNSTIDERDVPQTSGATAHIALMCTAFFIIFPCGIIMARNKKWNVHYGFQITGFVITTIAFILGFINHTVEHVHGAETRSNDDSRLAHLIFGIILYVCLSFQFFVGVCKVTIRRISNLVQVHKRLGYIVLILFYFAFITGMSTKFGLCAAWPWNCVGHFSLGTCLFFYGLISLYSAITPRSDNAAQHFCGWNYYIEGLAFVAFGLIYTLSEHDWSESLFHLTDIEHIALGGITNFFAGILTLFIEYYNRSTSIAHRAQVSLGDEELKSIVDEVPRVDTRHTNRYKFPNIAPALSLYLTGSAMSGHHQADYFSTVMHTNFGNALIFAAICRLLMGIFSNNVQVDIGTKYLFSFFTMGASILLFGSSHGANILGYIAMRGDPNTWSLYLFAILMAIHTYIFALIILDRKLNKT